MSVAQSLLTSGTLELWINSFIPRFVPNYTRIIPSGAHGGKSAIPLPTEWHVDWLIRLHPGNWDLPSAPGFLTDQRGFSSQRGASVRLQSSATIALNPRNMIVTAQQRKTSGTIGVNLDDGREFERRNASTRFLSSGFIGKQPFEGDITTGRALNHTEEAISVIIRAAGSDPLISAAADIDYNGRFQVIRDAARRVLIVNFAGNIDEFPAFEAYAALNGRVQTLFRSPPPRGNTVLRLLGPANRPVSGSVTFR